MWKLVLAVLAAVSALGSAGLVGGLRDIEVTDPRAVNALNFFLQDHETRTNSPFHSVGEIVKAQTQVVSGINYYLTVNLSYSSCRKNSAETVCPVHQNKAMAETQQCRFVVYNQPWTNTIKVTESTCEPGINTKQQII